MRPMLSAQAVPVWQGILEYIEQKTTPQQFATWFRNLQADAITDDKVVLTVPSRFHRDWIATYYRDVVEGAVAAVVGRRLPVHLEVNAHSAAEPSAARPTPAQQTPPKGGGRPPEARKSARGTPPAAPAALAVRTCGDLPLTEGFDFEHFVIGASNQLAAAAGQSLAAAAATDFSTLLVLGSTGIGKTHLLQAIARAALLNAGGARQVAYLRGENFLNEFVTACAAGAEAASKFRDRWRTLDFVCFDDLHLLAGKTGTQAELVHTLNAWCDRGTRVVFAASCAAGESLNLDAALLARLASAYRVGLRAPDRETRRALLASKAAVRGDAVPADVIEFLAELPTANVRELEGALTTAVAGARLTGTPLSLRSARASLQDDALLQRPASSPERIMKAVCQHFEVSPADLCSPRRPQALSFARQAAMYLLRERTELSLSEIGDVLGGRDHTTILHGVRKIEEGVTSDGRVRDHVSRLRQLLDH
jgi:chromosomal replication initiator protein